MKISELVDLLQTLPQDAEVCVVEPEFWEGETERREPEPIVKDNGCEVVL